MSGKRLFVVTERCFFLGPDGTRIPTRKHCGIDAGMMHFPTSGSRVVGLWPS